jgi:hypothetical protein
MNINNNVKYEDDAFMNGVEDQGQDYQYSLSCDTGTRFKAPGDWTLPAPTWPDSPLTESPPSSSASAGIYQDNSWNPFERSFGSIQNSIDNGNFLSSPLPRDSFLGCPPDAYQAAYNNSNPQRVPSYVTLSAINESNMFNNDYQDNDETPRPLQNTSGSSIAGSSPITPPDIELRSRQPAWGTPKSPRRSSNSSITVMKPPKRRKSETSSELPSRLRSTQFTPRPTTASSGSSNDNYPGRGTRTNHNHVEKQYRNRLNGQFESLLQMLPREENGLANEKRVSKAEVLILAKKHIEELEREKRELEEENVGLEETVTELKKRWVNLGGVCMP